MNRTMAQNTIIIFLACISLGIAYFYDLWPTYIMVYLMFWNHNLTKKWVG